MQRFTYDTIGNVLEESGDAVHPFAYGGGLRDPATGLTRFGARDVEHRIGRWTARDPVRFKSGQMNMFLHAHGDPLNAVDATGLATYRCTRPLGDHDPYGDDLGGPGPLHHEYPCIWQGSHVICDGQTSDSGKPFGSDGASSGDNWNPNRCQKVREDDACFESCVASELQSGAHPSYDIGGFGQGERRHSRGKGMTGRNCQGYARDVSRECDNACSTL